MEMGSFQNSSLGAPNSQWPKFNSSKMEGVPQTEDAENMPTMSQMKLKFTVTSSKDEEQKRSGVFGGHHDSQLSLMQQEQYPSFREQTPK